MAPTRNPSASDPRAAAEESFQEACQVSAVLRGRARTESEALSGEADALAARQATLRVDEEILHHRRRDFEIQQQQMSDELDRRRARLAAQDAQLQEADQLLAAERADWERVRDDQRREWEAARRQLNEERGRLDDERKTLAADRATSAGESKQHWEAEAGRLRAESDRLAADRQAFERQLGHVNAQLEVQRRQLDASWNQFRREQADWREFRRNEEARLQEGWDQLAERQRALRAETESWEQTRRDQELAHAGVAREAATLGNRIRNHRRKLHRLRDEAARLEETVCAGSLPVAQPIEESGSTQAGDSAPSIPDPSLETLAAILEGLLDENRRLAEHQQLLAEVRRSWRWEWDYTLKELRDRESQLTGREETIAPRERSLNVAELAVQTRTRDLERWEQQLQCWEARLFKAQSTFQCERGRLLAHVKARMAAAQERFTLAVRLRHQGQADRRRQSARLVTEQQAAEKARRDLVRRRDALHQRIAELELLHRRLLERDLALTQIQQELVATDPRPDEADRELDRRRQHWERAALRPIRALRRRERAAAKKAAEMEALHRDLAQQKVALEEQQAACAQLQTDLEIAAAELSEERGRWQQELRANRQETAQLERHAAELRHQLERVAALLIDSPRPQPPLAVAA